MVINGLLMLIPGSGYGYKKTRLGLMHRQRPGSHWVGHNLVEADGNVDAAPDELLRSHVVLFNLDHENEPPLRIVASTGGATR